MADVKHAVERVLTFIDDVSDPAVGQHLTKAEYRELLDELGDEIELRLEAVNEELGDDDA